MRSGGEDVSTRARIRDAAIEVFGSTGFGAPVRAVAARAGVSPGLLHHHFGSRDGLREACDAHVLRRIRESRTDAMTGHPAAALARLAAVEAYAPLTAYVLQALQRAARWPPPSSTAWSPTHRSTSPPGSRRAPCGPAATPPPGPGTSCWPGWVRCCCSRGCGRAAPTFPGCSGMEEMVARVGDLADFVRGIVERRRGEPG